MTERKKRRSAKSAASRPDDDVETSGRKAAPLGANKKKRQSEFAVSRGGMNQESRQHSKPRPDQRA